MGEQVDESINLWACVVSSTYNKLEAKASCSLRKEVDVYVVTYEWIPTLKQDANPQDASSSSFSTSIIGVASCHKTQHVASNSRKNQKTTKQKKQQQ